MQSLNSDQLRKLLKKHTRKMNWLAKQNDLIVELLAERGLKAIEPDNNDVAIHPCVMQLDKLGEALFRTQFEPKRREEIALTAEELNAGGWWCADVSEECRLAFADSGTGVTSNSWNDYARVQCAYKPDSESNVMLAHLPVDLDILKQIHRIGNNFYWGAASDQAN